LKLSEWAKETDEWGREKKPDSMVVLKCRSKKERWWGSNALDGPGAFSIYGKT